MELAQLTEAYRDVFRAGDFEFPALILSEDEKLRYAIKFPLYVQDQDSYITALNKAMMLGSYNNGINCAGLFVATDEGEFVFTALNNRIFLSQIDGEIIEEVPSNTVDDFTVRLMREYLSVYSRKDYSSEIVEALKEQGFDVDVY